jgi:hypothetical protein
LSREEIHNQEPTAESIADSGLFKNAGIVAVAAPEGSGSEPIAALELGFLSTPGTITESGWFRNIASSMPAASVGWTGRPAPSHRRHIDADDSHWTVSSASEEPSRAAVRSSVHALNSTHRFENCLVEGSTR